MKIPQDRRYTKTHEWAKSEGELVRVGISDYAQDQLGDIVFAELPEPGRTVNQNEGLGVIESVKAVADLNAPVSGEVVETNEALADQPELVNEHPYGEGWIVTIRPSDPAEYDALMDPSSYARHCEEE